MLVKIEEDEKGLRKHKQTGPVSRRIRELAERFGNSQGKRAFGVDVSDDGDADGEKSDTDAHEFFKDALVTDDWMGRFNCFLEFWELDEDRKPVLRGDRIVRKSSVIFWILLIYLQNIMPADAVPDPVILLSDMVPSVYQAENFDGARTLTLDLNTYRYYLGIGKKSLGHLRALRGHTAEKISQIIGKARKSGARENICH